MSSDLFQELLDIIAKLRDPETGCPWDIKQTHSSLKPYLIEEAHETLDAIDNDRAELPGELGDVLLQVVLHAQIGKDEGTFSIDDIIKELNDKLIRRHPHVFADTEVADAEEVKKNWKKIKEGEKEQPKGLLDTIPKGTTALLQAHKIGEATTTVGFDWRSTGEILEKVEEELDEVKEELGKEPIQKEALAEELGDLLFAVTHLVRLSGMDAETTLLAANQKFSRRFRSLEGMADKPIGEISFDELHLLWEKIKSEEKKR